MLSLDEKCHSYGAGADGFVPGEGVGTVVLKPLSNAIADQDHIYAVILGRAFDHSGRSNGYSAPNPNSQANLISRALEKAQIHPETIGYIEGHGTGTQLGDSIEIAALTKAFRKQTTKKEFCPIGSVKANIGHSESAAGMASLAKVVLQIYCQRVGNIMGATTMLSLLSAIDHGDFRTPQRIGCFSYGSGCCSEFFRGIVTNDAQERVRALRIKDQLDKRYELSMEEYDSLLVSNNAVKFGTRNIAVDNEFIPQARSAQGNGTLFLTEIKEFQRQYDRISQNGSAGL
jgi:3-hydroxy-3-methylglutaryl CoA synthase